MVVLKMTKGNGALFRFNAFLTTLLDQLTRDAAFIYNNRLCVERLQDG
jgi:hypothetical protein